MASPTRSELLISLIDYVNLSTGLDKSVIIRGNQNAPSPLNNYCSILYLSDTPIGTHNLKSSVDGIDPNISNVYVRGKREFQYSIQFYREGASEFAKDFILFAETPKGVRFQLSSPFIFNKIDNITQSSSVMSNNYEERAILNLSLLVNENYQNSVNNVDEVIVNLDYDGIIDETIEVPTV